MWLEASANELSVAISPPSSTLAVRARPALCCSQRQQHPAACLSLLWAAGGQGMRAPGQGSPPQGSFLLSLAALCLSCRAQDTRTLSCMRGWAGVHEVWGWTWIKQCGKGAQQAPLQPLGPAACFVQVQRPLSHRCCLLQVL